MQLTKHKVATLNYTLTDKEDNILDQSLDGSFSYIHGIGSIIPGLENALEGKNTGDEVKVVIEPEDAYGERSLDKIQRVPKDMFPEDVELKAGMQFQAQTSSGVPALVVITAVETEEVVIDGNHPMAGKQLHFQVEVVEVRDASEEEIQHKHVHGPAANET